ADGMGVAFVALDAADSPRLQFMTASRSLTEPSAPTQIMFDDPDGPVVTPLNGEYVLTFHQDSGVIGPAIYGVIIGKNGVVLGAPRSMTAGAAHARGNATYSYGDRFVMVWADDREGTYQLYAQTFDQKLSPISGLLRVTSTMSNTLSPIVAASSDGGLGVVYTDDANATQQTFFTRLDCQASQLGLK
ncbi:MAG TPA: hypothetical protein VEQ59_03465, partial [Polyangiaceae bacterium]|nr:hypothetical protein [Polyangiaceae bacterium]